MKYISLLLVLFVSIAANAQREVISLDGEWSFTDPDAGTTIVRVPHSWTSEGIGGYRMPTEKTCSYEKTIDVSAYAGRRLLLQFDGVNKIAVVKVDGEEVGRHDGGYTTFHVDITAAVEGKQTATVTVDVTNVSASTLPQSADFTQYAGIYREVSLVAVNPEVSLSGVDDGSKGVYFNYTLDGQEAKLTPTVVLDSKAEGTATIVTEVWNAEGEEVASDIQNVTLEGSMSQRVSLADIAISDIHLWNGTTDPYLYTAQVKVMYDSVEVDRFSQKIGFRTLMAKDGKFYLNGSVYPVRGIGMHQDQGGVTNVSTPEQRRSDVETAIEMGANALRTSHYPHHQQVYDLCDERGLLVWNEIPFSTVMLETDSFKVQTIQFVREMVKQSINHPSVMVWGIGNEVGQLSAMQYYPTAATKDQINDFLKVLSNTVKDIDTTRLIGLAHLSGVSNVQKTGEGLGKGGYIDVIGINTYKGWYSSVAQATESYKMASIVKKLQTEISSYKTILDEASDNTMSYVMTEYGAGANVEQHTDLGKGFAWAGKDGKNGYQTVGDFHPEEYQSFVHEGMFMATNGDSINKVKAAAGLWASFPWCLYDFSCYRDEGGLKQTNTKGLITADRQTRKDAFYLYKANWNKTDHFTHICSKRYTERTNTTVDVKVYSNCDRVELIVNGTNAGEGRLLQEGVFVWDEVQLAEGENNVVSRGYVNGSEAVYADTCDTWTTPLPEVPSWRESISLNGEWSFTDPDVGSPVTVQVPHSWDKAQPDGKIFAARQHTCNYTRSVDVSAYKGKRLLLKFEGVNKIATVRVDGDSITTHTGGFSTFYVDITEAAKDKDEVTLSIDVTNYDKKTMPVRCDFTHFGGIYRDVSLEAVNADISISNADFGSKGLYLNYTLEDQNAVLTPNLVLDSRKECEVNVQTTVSDNEGNIVSQEQQTVALTDATLQNVSLNAINLAGVHLWNGLQDPYLYTVNVKVSLDGQLVDEVSDRVGFRTYEVRDDLFYLNGQLYPLHGIGMHQEYGATTNVTTPEQRVEDIDNVLEIGANALRLVHYPHNQHTYDLCDEKGLIVWAELAFVSNMVEEEEFRPNGIQCLTEMIKQLQNHPSIIVWSIENEVDCKPNYQAMLPSQSTPEQIAPYMKELGQTAKALDSTRLVGETVQNTEAYLQHTASWTTPESGINTTGFNLYLGWYDTVSGATKANKLNIVTKLKDKIEHYRATIDSSSVGTVYGLMTEYGAGGNVDQHCDVDSKFVWGKKTSTTNYKSSFQFHPEEYQSWVHEANYMALFGDKTNAIESCPLWCTFTWALYDFSTYRDEGGIPRLNTKGLITADRKVKKDAFYLYKAHWNKTTPFTYICSRRYTDRPSSTVSVKVYSNCDKVELIVNGKNIGRGTKTQDCVFEWKKVSLRHTNKVQAVATVGGVKYIDEVTSWVSPASDEDVDGNGVVNICDITTLINYLSTEHDYDVRYDVNNDGQVNVEDVYAVREKMLGK